MSVTLRKDLNRPLTWDELDANFTTVVADNGVDVNGEAVTGINVETGLEQTIVDGISTIKVVETYNTWAYQSVVIGDSPISIDHIDKCGIEYDCQINGSESVAFDFLLFSNTPDGAQIKVRGTGITSLTKPIKVGTADGSKVWSVVTPTVFSIRGGVWYIEESSQLLHVEGATTFDGEGVVKKAVHGITTSPTSVLNASVSDDGVMVLDADLSDYASKNDLNDYAAKAEANTFTENQTFNKDITVYGKGNFDDQVNTKNVNGSGVLNLKINNEPPAINIGNAAIQHNKVSLFNSPAYLYEDSEYWGNTSGANSIINRAALDSAIEDALDEYDKKWEQLGEYVVSTNGNRPTGEAQQAGTLYVWHLTVASSTTSPNNEFKVRDISAYDLFNTTTEPFVLKLQQGDKSQYWKVQEAGWTTNNSTWHMSCNDVSGDDLVANQPVTLFMQVEDGESTYVYDGEGLGVPKNLWLGSDEVVQSQLVAHYTNTLNQASNIGRITLNNIEGNNEFRVIITQGARETRDYRISLGVGNATSEKRIRVNEVWECRVFADWEDGTNSNFFWTRIDDGASTFGTELFQSYAKTATHNPTSDFILVI